MDNNETTEKEQTASEVLTGEVVDDTQPPKPKTAKLTPEALQRLICNDKTIAALLNNKKAGSRLLQKSLFHFIAVFHYYLNNSNFTFKPFHIGLIARLQRLAADPDRKKNLYIGMPPRFGKSQICKYFVAWSYAIRRRSNFIYTSFSDELCAKASKEIKAIISSELFKSLFLVELDPAATAAELWQIKNGGSFRAATIAGAITGFGAGSKTTPGYAGALIIDDFLKASEAHSKAAKKAVNDNYNLVLKNRLEKPNTPIIIIAQRLAVDDLIGYIEENERQNWDFDIVQGLNEDTGQAAWSELMPADKLLELKDQAPGVFYAQYQQTPIVSGGGVFKTEWWQFYSLRDRFRFMRLFIAADTAMKTGRENDFTAIGCFGLTTDKKILLLDMVHAKMEAPELEKTIKAFYEKWRYPMSDMFLNRLACSAVYVEDKASGIGLIQSLRRQGVPVLPLKPTADKYTRAMEAVPTIAAGLFKLPENCGHPISQKVIGEAETFSADMSQKHDDIVDMICYGIQKATAPTGFI